MKTTSKPIYKGPKRVVNTVNTPTEIKIQTIFN